jgi:hypothetical protein
MAMALSMATSALPAEPMVTPNKAADRAPGDEMR